MATLIASPTVVEAVGTKPKSIEEFIGLANSWTDDVSIARIKSPAGWDERGQTPEFDEYTLVHSGTLRVETRGETFEVNAGQAIMTPKGARVRYSTPFGAGAGSIAACTPVRFPFGCKGAVR